MSEDKVIADIEKYEEEFGIISTDNHDDYKFDRIQELPYINYTLTMKYTLERFFDVGLKQNIANYNLNEMFYFFKELIQKIYDKHDNNFFSYQKLTQTENESAEEWFGILSQNIKQLKIKNDNFFFDITNMYKDGDSWYTFIEDFFNYEVNLLLEYNNITYRTCAKKITCDSTDCMVFVIIEVGNKNPADLFYQMLYQIEDVSKNDLHIVRLYQREKESGKNSSSVKSYKNHHGIA